MGFKISFRKAICTKKYFDFYQGAANSSGVVWTFMQLDEFPQLPKCPFSAVGDGLVAGQLSGDTGGLHPLQEMSEIPPGVTIAQKLRQSRERR